MPGGRLHWYADPRFMRDMLGSSDWGMPDGLCDPRGPRNADGTFKISAQYAMNVTDIGGGWNKPGPTAFRMTGIGKPGTTLAFITSDD